MQEANSLLLNVAEEHQHSFEIENKEITNCWIEYQQKKYRQLAISNQMICEQLEELVQPSAQGYLVDVENDVIMNSAPARHVAIELPPL